MIYSQEVLDYIVDSRLSLVPTSVLCEELKLPHETLVSLFSYQNGLREGSLTIINKKHDSNEGTVTLEMLRNGWYQKRQRSNVKPSNGQLDSKPSDLEERLVSSQKKVDPLVQGVDLSENISTEASDDSVDCSGDILIVNTEGIQNGVNEGLYAQNEGDISRDPQLPEEYKVVEPDLETSIAVESGTGVVDILPCVLSVSGVSSQKAEIVIRMYTKEAASANDILKAIKVPSAKTREILEKNNIPIREINRCVTLKDIKEIQQRLDSGEAKVSLAYEFGYTIHQLENGLNPKPKKPRKVKDPLSDETKEIVPEVSIEEIIQELNKDARIQFLETENLKLRERIEKYRLLYFELYNDLSVMISKLVKASAAFEEVDAPQGYDRN